MGTRFIAIPCKGSTTKMLSWEWEHLKRATETLERDIGDMEDMETLNLPLMALECLLMASLEDMAGLGLPLMVVQIFWGRRVIMCSLLHMAPNLLHMTPNLLHMAHNLLHMTPNLLHMALTFLLMVLGFLLMVHLLLRNHLQLMAVLALVLGRPTSELRRPICPLATVFLLAMVCRIMHTNLTRVVSHNILEPTSSNLPTKRLPLLLCPVN